jgi:hypothetical protein
MNGVKRINLSSRRKIPSRHNKKEESRQRV